MNDFQGFEIINPDKIEEYRHPGIWAMFGIRKGSKQKKYECLNVGKNKDIGAELKIDFERLKEFNLCKKRVYRNQFNESMFDYCEFASRLDWLYKEISERYEEILVILVAKKSEYVLEKYFAYATKAAYWVSNGKYNPERRIDESEIDRIKKAIDISSENETLIKQIDELSNWLKNYNTCENES